MTRLISALLLSLAVVASSTNAAGADTGEFRTDTADLAVDQALSEALDRQGVARIEVTLDLTGKVAADSAHPAAGTDVHPTVFDIAMMAAPGPMKLDLAGDFHLFHLAATKTAVARILEMTEVVAVVLGAEPAGGGQPLAKGTGGCQPSSSLACFQGAAGFGVTAVYGGVAGKVAAAGQDSAAYWAYSSNNWEVLAKVLNGCGINGNWWLLGAAAGTSSYTLTPAIYLPNLTITLPSRTASNAPIVHLQLFPCL